METLSGRTFERVILPVVVVLIALQVIASQMIWTLDITSRMSEDLFALFLAILWSHSQLSCTSSELRDADTLLTIPSCFLDSFLYSSYLRQPSRRNSPGP